MPPSDPDCRTYRQTRLADSDNSDGADERTRDATNQSINQSINQSVCHSATAKPCSSQSMRDDRKLSQWLLSAAMYMPSVQAFASGSFSMGVTASLAAAPTSCNAPHSPPPPTCTFGGSSAFSSRGDFGDKNQHRRRLASSIALASAWCSSAEFATNVDDDEEENSITTSVGNVSPSPRLWMEDIEQSEGYGGAYTVMRCEMIDSDGSSEGDGRRWKVWGQDFHLKRLRASYVGKHGMGQSAAAATGDGEEGVYFETSIAHTNTLILDMLDKAGDMMKAEMSAAAADTVPVVMLTVLWTKTADGDDRLPIRVRAHGSITSVPSPRHGTLLSAGIQTSVALPPPITNELTLQRDWSSFPNRYENRPDVKDSSWCRNRRPLEEMYKADEISEVLLARPIDGADSIAVGELGGIELLEGLTSNLFVVYKDGTLRTAALEGNVLRGYARYLVLEAAERLGLRHDDTNPVLLQDAIDGMWSEVFITSSIRLVVPVTSISVPEYKGETKITNIRSFRKIWASGSADNGHERRWTEALYQDIVTFEPGRGEAFVTLN